MDVKKANEDSNLDRVLDSIDVAIIDSCDYLNCKAGEFSRDEIDFSEFLQCSEQLYRLLSVRAGLKK